MFAVWQVLKTNLHWADERLHHLILARVQGGMAAGDEGGAGSVGAVASLTVVG